MNKTSRNFVLSAYFPRLWLIKLPRLLLFTAALVACCLVFGLAQYNNSIIIGKILNTSDNSKKTVELFYHLLDSDSADQNSNFESAKSRFPMNQNAELLIVDSYANLSKIEIKSQIEYLYQNGDFYSFLDRFPEEGEIIEYLSFNQERMTEEVVRRYFERTNGLVGDLSYLGVFISVVFLCHWMFLIKNQINIPFAPRFNADPSFWTLLFCVVFTISLPIICMQFVEILLFNSFDFSDASYLDSISSEFELNELLFLSPDIAPIIFIFTLTFVILLRSIRLISGFDFSVIGKFLMLVILSLISLSIFQFIGLTASYVEIAFDGIEQFFSLYQGSDGVISTVIERSLQFIGVCILISAPLIAISAALRQLRFDFSHEFSMIFSSLACLAVFGLFGTIWISDFFLTVESASNDGLTISVLFFLIGIYWLYDLTVLRWFARRSLRPFG